MYLMVLKNKVFVEENFLLINLKDNHKYLKKTLLLMKLASHQ